MARVLHPPRRQCALIWANSGRLSRSSCSGARNSRAASWQPLQSLACPWRLTKRLSGDAVAGQPQDVDLDRLLAERGDHLLRAAIALAGNRADGEDLLQAAMERLLRNQRRVHGDLEGYLRRIFYNPAAGGGRPPAAGERKPPPFPPPGGARLARALRAGLPE